MLVFLNTKKKLITLIKVNHSGLPPNQGNHGNSGKFRYNQGKSGEND